MHDHPLRGLVLCALLPTLAAQQPPLSPEHAVLKELVGTWDVTASAIGVPWPKPDRPQQQATSTLICGGFWLETVTRGINLEGHCLTGFDPGHKQFVRVSCGVGTEAAILDGAYDATQRTITWRSRDVPAQRRGTMTVVTLPSDDRFAERFGWTGPGGELQARMESAFVRSKTQAPADGKRDPAKAPTPEHALLQQFAGDWDCALTARMPGLDQPMRSQGHSREEVVSDGYWLRSVLQLEFGGSTTEGRGLLGFDGKSGYVRYWVDGGSPLLTVTTGRPEADGLRLRFTGTTRMPDGEVAIDETTELGTDRRHVTQRLTTGDGKDAGTFELEMTRRPPPQAK